MPLKHVNKAVFTAAAILCGAIYIAVYFGFRLTFNSTYRVLQLAVTAYILYLTLITPFDTEHAFARIRSESYTKYTLVFLMNLTGIAAAYWLAVTAIVWIIGYFALHDDMTAAAPMIHFFINLMFLNFLHIALCRWLRNASLRKVIIFTVPLVQAAMHFFGSDKLRRFLFMFYGTFNQPMPYIIGTYAVVFGILIFLILKKNRREYV